MKPSIPARKGPGEVWWWLLPRKPHSWALSLTASSVVSSLSLQYCPQSRCNNSLAFRTFVLLRLLLDLDTFGGVDPLGVSSIYEDGCGYKQIIIFHRLIRVGSFPECWLSANITAIPKGAPSLSLDRENCRPISLTPISLRCTIS